MPLSYGHLSHLQQASKYNNRYNKTQHCVLRHMRNNDTKVNTLNFTHQKLDKNKTFHSTPLQNTQHQYKINKLHSTTVNTHTKNTTLKSCLKTHYTP